MSPIQEAARRVVAQFEVHQSLRLLMQNTLAAIIETEVGPLVMKERGVACAERDKLRSEIAKERSLREKLHDAITRGGLDLSPCGMCSKLVACIPDGLPFCEGCAKKEERRQNGHGAEAMPAAGLDT